jgi:uncharacterized protein YndB with AHSA1/START domain
VTPIEYRTTRIVEASPEDVFAAWTDPAVLARWFGPGSITTPDVELDARPGGDYRFGMLDDDGSRFTVVGTFREVQPPRRLQFTWRWEDGVPHTFESVVTIELEPVGNATALTLVHGGFPDDVAASGYSTGWENSLPKLLALFV